MKMKAVICTKYGAPDVLKLAEIKKPIPKENEVLIKIENTAVTASDIFIRKLKVPGNPKFPKKQLLKFVMRLFLGFSKPRNPVLGLVFSGTIESIGAGFDQFKKGENVFGFTGESFSTYAEYICLSQNNVLKGKVALKPDNMSHAETVSITYGGVLALHFMQKMTLTNTKKILIYGASGAIGTIAIQIAKSYGSEITAVCGPSNLELVKSLGADKVIDYTKENASNELEEYDYIFDAVGKNKTSDLKRKLKKSLATNGNYISVDDGLLWLHPKYLAQLRQLCESEKIRSVIDKTYPIEQIVDAHEYVGKGHKKGNVIITVN